MLPHPPFSGKPNQILCTLTSVYIEMHVHITIRLSHSIGELGRKVEFSQPPIDVPKLFTEPLIPENNIKEKMSTI